MSSEQRKTDQNFGTFRNHRQKLFHVISHLQVSQISKITSKMWTGTWNDSRITTFEGQSAKRRSKKKNFKTGENQRKCNEIYIYDFRNHRQKTFHVISNVQVSQIPKITSKKWTGTWNERRMTRFQGQSAKRRSKKKNFKTGENQRNAIFIFMTFRNHRPIIFMILHIYKYHRFRKSHQKS